MAQFFVGMTVWLTLPMAATIASRAVTRDMVARPLLAALPLEPRQLLDGKIAVVRRRMLFGLSPLVVAWAVPFPKSVLIDLAWRSAAVLAGCWIYASAAVSVAFLTGGAQTARPQPGGTLRLEALLLFAPLGALLFAQQAWMTVVPLAALWLVAFEAKRAATGVVRWLDDGEDFERETPAWRAALAFAAFQGAQALAARVISTWTDDTGLVMGSSYALSGVVLVGLSVYGRRDLAPLRLMPQNPLFIAIGVAAGIGTATFGRFVVHRFIAPHVDASDMTLTRIGELIFILSAGTFAPVVEEIFFRGWLQHVIARDLEAPRRWLAPAIAALAFASVHPPASFPAVFSLGLVAGILYARTAALGPCIAAHAAHNWVATLVQ
jgi:membrane protease YdiL (CAAX protease family)